MCRTDSADTPLLLPAPHSYYLLENQWEEIRSVDVDREQVCGLDDVNVGHGFAGQIHAFVVQTMTRYCTPAKSIPYPVLHDRNSDRDPSGRCGRG